MRRAIFAFLFASGCAAPSAMIFTGGKVWTGDRAHPHASAILVEHGTVRAVGDDAEVSRVAPHGARRVALRGRVVLPGFEDAHIHILGGGRSLDRVDLSSAKTKLQIAAAVHAYAQAHPDRPWILGRGWSYDTFKPAMPTAAELDAIVSDRPVYLGAYDGHSAWVNSRALALAGITAATPEPKDGTIVRIAGSQEPAGALLEDAMSLVAEKLPKSSATEKKDAIVRALQLAASLGVTSAGEVGGELEDLALYEELAQKGRLPIRVSYGPAVEDGAAAYAPRARALAAKSGLLMGGPQKGFVDGVVESNTAQLLAVYADGTGAGTPPHLDEPTIEKQLRAARAVGLDVAYHAVGDGAVHAVLDAVERSGATGTSGARSRIEHIEVVDPADVPRFAALGVIASMMPIHADPSSEAGEEIGVWSKKLGPERLRFAFAFRTLHEAGARLAFGSDWPVAPIDPLRAIAIAVTRQNVDGQPSAGWIPAQRIDVDTALTAYTAGSAYAMRLDERTGVLKPGMAADLVVLDAAVDLARPETFRTGRVDLTVCDGRVVYERSAK